MSTVPPEHWTLTRLGWLFKPSSEKEHPNETVLSVFRDHGVVPKDSRSDNFNRTPENLSAYQLVRPGDLVVNRMKAWQGSLGISAYRGIVSPDYEVLRRVAHEAEPRYLHQLLRSRPLIDQYGMRSTGIRPSQWRLYWGQMKTIEVVLPPVTEQRAIADYLDHETAQIDTLIAKQEQLIATLRERRAAAVAEHVFGRDAGSSLRRTAEDWLPDVPADWRVVQLGFVADSLPGWAFASDGFTLDCNDVRLLRGVNVKPGRTDWSDVVYWDPVASPVPEEFFLKPGDLVLGMDRPFVGGGVRVAAIEESDLPALLLQRVMRMRPHHDIDRAYLAYAVSTRAFLAYLEPLFTGVSVPHISEWQVRKFKIPLPPIEEQHRIVASLDEQTVMIDALIAKTERFIELSKERRTALITAAVTGQIDVRASA